MFDMTDSYDRFIPYLSYGMTDIPESNDKDSLDLINWSIVPIGLVQLTNS